MNIISRDIHNHILPGVDDGFRTPEDSLRAIWTLSQEGCRDITFTPHFNPAVYPGTTEEGLKAAYEAFIPRIPRDWKVKTHLAAEYMVVNDFEKRVADDPESLLHFEDGSVLIEMSYFFRSLNLEQSIFELTMAGYKPILAHPERYTYMAGSLKDFDKIVNMGCRLQLNYMSLTGTYGSASLKILKHLLSHGMYSFVATDLHTDAQLHRILNSRPNGFRLRWMYGDGRRFEHKQNR